jgi:LCP family protein required for cell wall assembly
MTGLLLGVLVAVYLLLPLRRNTLILGIDRSPEGTLTGRSDLIILTSIIPLEPYIGMLSIPRDLWVSVPGVGENRINTAHFFAENAQPGSGPAAAVETVAFNFGVDVHSYVRVDFQGLEMLVDALGGVTIIVEQPTAVLPAGEHLLDGETALAFVRDRAGSDDFGRMARTQAFLRALLRTLSSPRSWVRLPGVLDALAGTVDTDLPLWELPRIALAVWRTGPNGIDARTINREMVSGFQTESGAQVLAPDWNAINPVLMEMFGQ